MITAVAHGTSASEVLDQPVQMNEDDVSVRRLDSDYQLNSRRWTQIIDVHFVEWGKGGEPFLDAEIESPSRKAVNMACKLALGAREDGLRPPTRVVPDGDGGIVFEFESSSYPYYIEIYEDGSADLLIFHGTKLDSRESLSNSEALA